MKGARSAAGEALPSLTGLWCVPSPGQVGAFGLYPVSGQMALLQAQQQHTTEQGREAVEAARSVSRHNNNCSGIGPGRSDSGSSGGGSLLLVPMPDAVYALAAATA